MKFVKMPVIIMVSIPMVIDTMVEVWAIGRIRIRKSFPFEAYWRITKGTGGAGSFVRENSIETEAGTVPCLIPSPRTSSPCSYSINEVFPSGTLK